MTPATHIERMTAAGWERVARVRLRALADAPDAFGSTLEVERSRPAAWWQAHLADAQAATFLAVRDGEDVGMARGALWRGREPLAGLFSMWVAPEARCEGVGDGLVRAVVAWARAAGHPLLVLEVGDANAAAVALYARHGFRPTGLTGVVAADRPHITEHERALDL